MQNSCGDEPLGYAPPCDLSEEASLIEAGIAANACSPRGLARFVAFDFSTYPLDLSASEGNATLRLVNGGSSFDWTMPTRDHRKTQ